MGTGEGAGGAHERLAVEPTVHVERYEHHCSFTWRADGLERFLRAVAACDAVPDGSTPVVDATNAAGRRRLALREIDTTGATTYVRVDPPRPWTLSWERRTEPVVSLTGLPVPSTCRRLHVATTGCDGWSSSPLERVAELTGFWE
jgi:hypothetical protein